MSADFKLLWPIDRYAPSVSFLIFSWKCPLQLFCPRLTIVGWVHVDRQELQVNDSFSFSVTRPRGDAPEKPPLHPRWKDAGLAVDALIGWHWGWGRSWQRGVYVSYWRIMNFYGQSEDCGRLFSETATPTIPLIPESACHPSQHKEKSVSHPLDSGMSLWLTLTNSTGRSHTEWVSEPRLFPPWLSYHSATM